MSPATLAHASAAVHVSITAHQVLLLCMTGLLTSAALRGVRARLADHQWGGQHVGSYIVDFRSAVCAFDARTLDELALSDGEPPPGALLVLPLHGPLMAAHSRRMAGHGITRRVFLAEREAHAWAQRQAALNPPR